MLCPHCQANIDKDTQFCPQCGQKIMATSRPSAKIRIGRAPDNDIVIAAPTVSGHHCELIPQADGSYLLQDLGSTNGTFVNGARISQQRVRPQDNVMLAGRVKLDMSQFQAPKPRPQIPIDKDVITIGRDPSCDVYLNNVKVSRLHARLSKVGAVWQLEDLGSKNGTFVNGKRLTGKLNLSANDSFSVGGVVLHPAKLFGAAKRDWSSELRLVGKGLSFSVPGKTIVDNVDICFEAGQFVGLIGPSGCGKTTLMMMLNGYLPPSIGKVEINGLSLYQNLSAFQGQLGYVPQDDIIHREIKVGESLSFTSELRLGDQLTSSEREQQIEQILKTLNLLEARETLIGSPEKKGISGGQRKRVNMAQELITEPLFYFLDEPTSGLDPRSDREVMLLLKDIAASGKVVILTTHKIDQLNFSIFTHLIVLTPGGRLAYYGPAAAASAYFGVKNPEDIFDALQRKDPLTLQREFLESKHHQKWLKDGLDAELKSAAKLPKNKPNDPIKQFFILMRRNFLIKSRDHFSAAVLLLQAPIIGLLISLVFNSAENIGGLYFVLVVAAIWLGCSNSAREIVSEQSIFKREQKAALSVTAYLWSKISTITIISALQCFILCLFAFFTLELNISFLSLFASLTLTSFSALSMGLLLSALVKTSEAAMALVPVVLIPQVILGGLVVSFGSLPEVMQTISGGILARWSYELLLLLEDKPFLIAHVGFNQDNLILDIFMIMLMGLFFIALSHYTLKKKTK